MSSIILKLFGIQGEAARTIEKLMISFLKPWSLFIALLAVLGIIIFVSFIYKKESKPVTKKLKFFLTTMRILALLILLGIIFEPVIIIEQSTDEKPKLVVVVDNSMSMKIKDPALGERMGNVNKAFENKELNLIGKLNEKFDLKLWTFSSEINQIKVEKVKKETGKKEEIMPVAFSVDNGYGQRTQMGDALAKALFELKGSSAAGIILVSDGGSNFGEDPLAVAYSLESSNIPVYSVGVGDPNPPKDVKLTNIFVNPIAHVGDRISVNIDVVNTGYKGSFVTVRMIDKKTKEIKKEVKRQLENEREKQKLDIDYNADKDGEFEYEISVVPFPDEISSENNSKNFHIKVEKKRIKVLYVEGQPRWLYRFLKNMMYREKSLDFSVLLESADREYFKEGTKPIRKFPSVEQSDTYGDPGLFDYDILIIGDVSKDYFNKQQFELIEKFVKEHEGGLMMIAGEINGAPSIFSDTPIADILPVGINGTKTDGYKYPGNGVSLQLSPMVSSDNFLQLIGENQGSAKYVFDIFKFYWTADVKEIKGTGKSLAFLPSPDKNGKDIPVVVIGKYGLGNTIYLGIDELWRMRREVEDKYFAPLFGQAIKWLAPRRFAAEKFVSIETDEKEVIGGQKVSIHARLLTKAYTPLKSKEVILRVSCNDEFVEEVPLYFASQDGIYSGEYLPQRAGKYTMWIDKNAAVEDLGEEPGKTKESFFVKIPNLEFENPELNEELLKKISERTKGKYYRVDKIKDLTDVMLSTRAKVTIKDQRELHDSPLFALAMIAFFSTEWFLRRRKGLA